MLRIPFISVVLILVLFSGGCEKDILENYRKNYTGDFYFTTIREDMSVIPFEIIDTTYYSGTIEAIYSNRVDLIGINFLPGNTLDALVRTNGYLSLPLTGTSPGMETLDGFFTDANARIVFHYRISSGSNYSVNHRVEGIRP